MSKRVARSPRRLVWVVLGVSLIACAFVGARFAYPSLSRWFSKTPSGPSQEALPPSEPEAADPSAAPTATLTQAGTGSRIGERAPDFTLVSLGGQSVSLSQFRGRVVILDFWASWCGPCRATMPSLHALWRDIASRGVDLVGVSLDRTAEAASSYLAANGFQDMIALWGSLAAAQAVASKYRVDGIPRTVVIDRNGIVRFNGHSATLDRALLESVL